MNISPFKTPRPTPSSFQNYFYQVKPFLRHRPSTPTPISKQFFSNTSNRDHSFHTYQKRGSKTPLKCCTLDMRPLNTETNMRIETFSSGKLTFMQHPESRLETEYQSGSSQQNDSGPILEIDYRSPVHNIKKKGQEVAYHKKDRSPSLVECETEESIRKQEGEIQSFKRITGRDLSLIRLEEKSLQEYIGTIETRIRKFEDEEKSIQKKIEITRKFEEKIHEKRKDIETMMSNISNKRSNQEKITAEMKQRNQMEKKLHKENVQKNANRITFQKQRNAVQLKENKENLMEKANLKKEIDFSEKIVKVHSVLNFEKKLKSKKVAESSIKGAQVQNSLLTQLKNENQKVEALKMKAMELEKKEAISKEKLEEMKQLHLIKYFKLQQTLETKEDFKKVTTLTNRGYTMASTATFDERKSSGSDIVTFDSRHINTSVLSMCNKKN